MKELSPSLLILSLLAVQVTYSYSVWAAQQALSMGLMLPYPFYGQAVTKQSGVKWHLYPQAGSCEVTHWSMCQSGHHCSPVPGSRAVSVILGLSSEGLYILQWFSLCLFRCCFFLDTTLALLAMMTSFTSHSYLLNSG